MLYPFKKFPSYTRSVLLWQCAQLPFSTTNCVLLVLIIVSNGDCNDTYSGEISPMIYGAVMALCPGKCRRVYWCTRAFPTCYRLSTVQLTSGHARSRTHFNFHQIPTRDKQVPSFITLEQSLVRLLTSCLWSYQIKILFLLLLSYFNFYC